MDSADVVTASLKGLARCEVVCVPGLTEPEALDRLLEAEAGLRGAGGRTLAARYRSG